MSSTGCECKCDKKLDRLIKLLEREFGGKMHFLDWSGDDWFYRTRSTDWDTMSALLNHLNLVSYQEAAVPSKVVIKERTKGKKGKG